MQRLEPDCVLFVGDLSEGDLGIVKDIRMISLPTAVILGNHDRGNDQTGVLLKNQISVLDELHCGWRLRKWESPPISVVGARPCSSGGGFHLSKAVKALYGSLSIQESAEMIVAAALEASCEWPLIVLAHSGPTGLGSEFSSLCGRDWKAPPIDWGDQDLALALSLIRKQRIPELVVFGHMHHYLKRGGKFRQTILQDCWGTFYLNAACVPRAGRDKNGRKVFHFSWVEFFNRRVDLVAHRWFFEDSSIAYEELLFQRS